MNSEGLTAAEVSRAFFERQPALPIGKDSDIRHSDQSSGLACGLMAAADTEPDDV